jgi:hypothetical protein
MFEHVLRPRAFAGGERVRGERAPGEALVRGLGEALEPAGEIGAGARPHQGKSGGQPRSGVLETGGCAQRVQCAPDRGNVAASQRGACFDQSIDGIGGSLDAIAGGAPAREDPMGSAELGEIGIRRPVDPRQRVALCDGRCQSIHERPRIGR